MTLGNTNGAKLERILQRDPTKIVHDVRSRIVNTIGTLGESIILFGAGYLGRYVLRGLRNGGIEPLAFVDNNSAIWGRSVADLQVLSPPDAIAKFGKKAVFVITIYTAAPIRRQLSEFGVTQISFAELAWLYPQTLMPHGAVEFPYKIYEQADEITNCMDIWADQESKQEFLAQIQWRNSLNTNILPDHDPPKETYFPEGLFQLNDNELFVDCGAFDGDSIKEFLARRNFLFHGIVAIEPDPVNFEALKLRVAELPFDVQRKITALQVAIGSHNRRVLFSATGTAASAVGTGSFEVQSTPLDELLNGVSPTLIKMDLEGAEIDALLGARKTIQHYTPILAVCLYHQQEHLWQIPILIRSISPNYNLFLRRYSDECWELVCYAVPRRRLIRD